MSLWVFQHVLNGREAQTISRASHVLEARGSAVFLTQGNSEPGGRKARTFEEGEDNVLMLRGEPVVMMDGRLWPPKDCIEVFK